MSQHDYNLANASGPTFRADANAALAAIATQNAGPTAPSPSFANQIWYDTATAVLKKRDNNNTVWQNLFRLDSQNNITFVAPANDRNPIQVVNATNQIVATLRVDTAGHGRVIVEDVNSVQRVHLIGSIGAGKIFLDGDESTGKQVAPTLSLGGFSLAGLTSLDIAIPVGAIGVQLNFRDVVHPSSASMLVQLGTASAIVSSGYVGVSGSPLGLTLPASVGFPFRMGVGGVPAFGIMNIAKADTATDPSAIWVTSHGGAFNGEWVSGGGAISLSNNLTTDPCCGVRVRHRIFDRRRHRPCEVLMASAIDASKPIDGVAAIKADVRANFAAAKSEIEALQAGGGGGGGGVPTDAITVVEGTNFTAGGTFTVNPANARHRYIKVLGPGAAPGPLTASMTVSVAPASAAWGTLKGQDATVVVEKGENSLFAVTVLGSDAAGTGTRTLQVQDQWAAMVRRTGPGGLGPSGEFFDATMGGPSTRQAMLRLLIAGASLVNGLIDDVVPIYDVGGSFKGVAPAAGLPIPATGAFNPASVAIDAPRQYTQYTQTGAVAFTKNGAGIFRGNVFQEVLFNSNAAAITWGANFEDYATLLHADLPATLPAGIHRLALTWNAVRLKIGVSFPRVLAEQINGTLSDILIQRASLVMATPQTGVTGALTVNRANGLFHHVTHGAGNISGVTISELG